MGQQGPEGVAESFIPPARASGESAAKLDRLHNPFAKPRAVLGRIKAVERILE